MLKRKLVQYGDSDDSHAPTRQSNGYPNKSSRIESKSNTAKSSSRKTSVSKHGPEDSTGPNSSAVSDDLDRLLGVLNNILGNNSKSNLLEQLGEEGYGQCERLQSALAEKSRGKVYNGSSQNANTCTQKHPEFLPPTSLTPWTASCIQDKPPSLPKIFDPVLEKEAFTHSAINNTSSYERLEWIGDIYLELTATLLISSTFPGLSPGRCSQLRERCVKNETLAKFSRQYGFEERAFLPPEFRHRDARGNIKATTKEMEKVMGDMFEAYCAAIVFSDSENGVHRLATWLKSLWARTLAPEILAIKPKIQNDGNPRNIPSKELLATKISSKGVKLSYKDAAPERKSSNISGHPIFTVGVYLDGWGVQGKLLGIGEGLSKKEAGSKAAEAALANKEGLRVYEEMKRESDEKRRAEQADGGASTDPTSSAS